MVVGGLATPYAAVIPPEMSPFEILLDRQLHLRKRAAAQFNPSRQLLAADALKFREAILLKNGGLGTWGAAHATGRIPLDTYTVDHGENSCVDWLQPTNRPLSPAVFDGLFHDALAALGEKDRVYITDRVIGAESRYALPVRTITDRALSALFTQTMFRPMSADAGGSVFHDLGFTLLVLPFDRVDTARHGDVLREVDGRAVDYLVAMDFERRAGVIIGTSYLGTVKKMLFTTMNHLLPEQGVLPLHCAAVEDWRGSTHLFLGLSGTGKTTLSSGPGLRLIGDDEHLWSDSGVANMENGCYAKLLRLSPEKEPRIHAAVFGRLQQGEIPPIVENALVLPDGSIDLRDGRLTENSRAAYELKRLPDAHAAARGGHPSTIFFLTADARGVLPPIAKLPLQQAMLWFLLGYTSKLAGTETGVIEPKATFSRFFGGAFMTRRSQDYLALFQRFVSEHRCDVYLVNTGWAGGPPGVGRRMDIAVTRRLVDAVLWGQLKEVPYREDKLFHLLVPRECPGIDPRLLDPKAMWPDTASPLSAGSKRFDEQSKALAEEFGKQFDALCVGEMLEGLREKCPGR